MIPKATPAIALDLRALFEQEYRTMLRVATLLIGSATAAEDVVQDAFVGVAAKLPRLDKPGAYLRTAVVNGCRSQQRRERRGERAIARLDVVESGVAEVDELGDALARLSDRQRAAIVLRYYLDLSEADIAATIGCRPGTVKALLHRGLAALREVIDR